MENSLHSLVGEILPGRNLLPNLILFRLKSGEVRLHRSLSKYNYLAFASTPEKRLWLVLFRNVEDIPPDYIGAVRKIYWRKDMKYGVARIGRLLYDLRAFMPSDADIARAMMEEKKRNSTMAIFELKFLPEPAEDGT